ncbi:MAG: hypothetical protein ACK5T0_00205 [Vampirovibrionales bacterium]
MTSIASNTQVSQASFPSKTQVVEKEDTPSYKTYPFALGTSGLVLGGLGGLLKTSLEPDVYSKTEANGESKRLAVKYSQQSNKPLAYATYEHYRPSDFVKGSPIVEDNLKNFANDTASFDLKGNTYTAKIPHYTANAEGKKTLVYESAFWNTEAKALSRIRDLKGLQSPLSSWWEAPLLPNAQSQGLEGMTHGAQLTLKKAIKLEGEPSNVIHLYHTGERSKTAKLFLKEGHFIDVALNEQGEIHNAKIDALNGLPVLFKEPLPDMKNVMKDVPAYVNKLKASLVKEEKAFGKNIFLGTLVTGGLGYGLGWFLDWKKRHDRNTN